MSDTHSVCNKRTKPECCWCNPHPGCEFTSNSHPQSKGEEKCECNDHIPLLCKCSCHTPPHPEVEEQRDWEELRKILIAYKDSLNSSQALIETEECISHLLAEREEQKRQQILEEFEDKLRLQDSVAYSGSYINQIIGEILNPEQLTPKDNE